MSEVWSLTHFAPHVKYPLFSSDFNEALSFSPQTSKKHSNIKFKKIRPLEAELFHADRQTETINLKVDFFQFYERA